MSYETRDEIVESRRGCYKLINRQSVEITELKDKIEVMQQREENQERKRYIEIILGVIVLGIATFIDVTFFDGTIKMAFMMLFWLYVGYSILQYYSENVKTFVRESLQNK